MKLTQIFLLSSVMLLGLAACDFACTSTHTVSSTETDAAVNCDATVCPKGVVTVGEISGDIVGADADAETHADAGTGVVLDASATSTTAQ